MGNASAVKSLFEPNLAHFFFAVDGAECAIAHDHKNWKTLEWQAQVIWSRFWHTGKIDQISGWRKMNTSFVRMTSFSLHYFVRHDFLVIGCNSPAFYDAFIYIPARACSNCSSMKQKKTNSEINHNCRDYRKKRKKYRNKSGDSQMSFDEQTRQKCKLVSLPNCQNMQNEYSALTWLILL